ncbi:hypothetical protein Tco_0573773 [Tanacetum coccineum]
MIAEERVKVLEGEKLDLVGKLSQAETDRKVLVREFIPTVVKRLHTSFEYQKSLAATVGLCFTAGWLGGLGLGRTEEEIAKFLTESTNLDIEGSKTELLKISLDVPPLDSPPKIASDAAT